MSTYSKYSASRTAPGEIPQSVPVSPDQQLNNAGGYTFTADKWAMFHRFLILGSDGGTYYVDGDTLTMQNAQNVVECIKEDGKRTVDTIVKVSHEGRAPKNDPALFALAMCASFGDDDTRRYALENLQKVARIGTHLFHFVQYIKNMRGVGRGLRTALVKWYDDKSISDLAYQVVKYQQRDGWSHRDILRISHPKTDDKVRNAVYKWIVDGELHPTNSPDLLRVVNLIKGEEDEKEVISLIREYDLPREVVPTQFLNSADVWDALLDKMPLTAMLRNLNKMTAVGLLTNNSARTDFVVRTLADANYIHKSRLHPLTILNGQITYAQGQGMRGSLTWNPVAKITNALDDAFYLAFDNVEPTGKSIMYAVDISGSMSAPVANGVVPARTVAAALALVSARREQDYLVTGFAKQLVNLDIDPRMRLDQVARKMDRYDWGSTDASQPMIYANRHGIPIDAFVVITDNETWAGRQHPHIALQDYRAKFEIPARLVVVATAATRFSIADPNDPGMLDISGFSTDTPTVIADFISGKI